MLTRVHFTLCLLGWTLHAQTLDVPFLAGRVNDNASLLSAPVRDELEALLKAHEDSTSNQVVVLTIPSLQNESLEAYSIKVAETWKPGQKDKDNGVLLLVAKDDRKVRLEVGDGLEGSLPDITCGQIIRREIVPRFHEGDYAGGIRDGVQAILAAIAGSYQTEPADHSPNNLLFILFIIVLIVVVFFILTRIITRVAAGSSSRESWPTPGQRWKSMSEGWSGETRSSSQGGSSSGRSRRSGGSSSRGGFSGGGGSFSGGGASGRW